MNHTVDFCACVISEQVCARSCIITDVIPTAELSLQGICRSQAMFGLGHFLVDSSLLFLLLRVPLERYKQGTMFHYVM